MLAGPPSKHGEMRTVRKEQLAAATAACAALNKGGEACNSNLSESVSVSCLAQVKSEHSIETWRTVAILAGGGPNLWTYAFNVIGRGTGSFAISSVTQHGFAWFDRGVAQRYGWYFTSKLCM